MVSEISAREVHAARQQGELFRLIDCREASEVSLARIEGAEVVPLSQWGTLAPQLFQRTDERVVIFCHAGVRSAYAAADLARRGLTAVQSMAGGIDAWSLDVDPSVPRY